MRLSGVIYDQTLVSLQWERRYQLVPVTFQPPDRPRRPTRKRQYIRYSRVLRLHSLRWSEMFLLCVCGYLLFFLFQYEQWWEIIVFVVWNKWTIWGTAWTTVDSWSGCRVHGRVKLVSQDTTVMSLKQPLPISGPRPCSHSRLPC